jgi:predicted TIM-barrel fold metal-dependent hydrolase
MHCGTLSIAVAIAATIMNPIAHAAQAKDVPVRYMDAHSHLMLPKLTPDEEIPFFKKAGVTAVVIMHPDPDMLRAVAKKYPGYVIPFISIARTPDMPGLRLSEDTAAIFARLLATGEVCGFGELPTRLEPKADPSDDVALLKSMRMKIYDLANAHGVPVNMHVDLNTPAVIEAFADIAASHPHMPLILAHAGWSAGPDVVDGLLAAYPNIYVDLSIRLDPPFGFGTAAVSRQIEPNKLSILTADGALQPKWRALLARFPDRFMFGMDVSAAGASGRQERIGDLLAAAGTAFGALPRDAQEAIAHGNLEKLLHGCGTLKSKQDEFAVTQPSSL